MFPPAPFASSSSGRAAFIPALGSSLLAGPSLVSVFSFPPPLTKNHSWALCCRGQFFLENFTWCPNSLVAVCNLFSCQIFFFFPLFCGVGGGFFFRAFVQFSLLGVPSGRFGFPVVFVPGRRPPEFAPWMKFAVPPRRDLCCLLGKRPHAVSYFYPPLDAAVRVSPCGSLGASFLPL